MVAVFAQFATFLTALAAGRPRWRPRRRQNGGVNLARIAWLTTTLACLLAAVVLLLEKPYYGYAGVCLAVAVSAAINLL
jgi:hypothetical protein